jgi:hypothetical protein
LISYSWAAVRLRLNSDSFLCIFENSSQTWKFPWVLLVSGLYTKALFHESHQGAKGNENGSPRAHAITVADAMFHACALESALPCPSAFLVLSHDLSLRLLQCDSAMWFIALWLFQDTQSWEVKTSSQAQAVFAWFALPG